MYLILFAYAYNRNINVPFFFQKIELPFLAAVQMTLHDRFTDNVETIYKLTIKFIIETLIEGFDEAEGKKSH